jgi:hypothetical protein
MLFMYRLRKTASLHLFAFFIGYVKRILGVTMISDFRGARLRHYYADGARCECWNHTEANSNCSISGSDWLIALDTKCWCKLDAIWRETNLTLSFIWLLCVCLQKFPTIQNFLNITVYPWDARYISPCPIYFKHNLQHIVASRNCNYIVRKGANDFSVLIFWTLPNLAKSILTGNHHLSNITNLGDKKNTALSMDFSSSQILINPVILSRRGSMLELDKFAVAYW